MSYAHFHSSLSRVAITLCVAGLAVATNLEAQTATVSPAALNFSSVAAQSTSAIQTLTFTFTAAGTLGSYQVLTGGIANRDFAAAPTSTCQSQAYSKNATCTVDVTFAPGYPGPRFGAVVLYNSSKLPIATAYIQGVATGPQAVFLPGTPALIVNSNLYQPKNMVVDPAANIFVANAAKCQIVEFSPPSYTVTATISTLLSGSCFSPTNGGEPRGVAVDGAGNVYAVTSDTGTVLRAELKSDGTYSAAAAILGSTTLDTPSSVAADGAGNLYITDSFTRLTASHNRILMAAVQAGGGYTVSTIASTGSNSQPWGLTVDTGGNVYYSDITQNTVVRLTSGSWASTQVASGLFGPYGLAVDAAGDVYIADTNNSAGNQLVEAIPNAGGGSYTQKVVTGTLSVSNLRGVGLDLQGNVYVVDQVVNKVNDVTDVGKIFRLDRADPPALTFPDTPFGSSSPAQDVTVQNIGNTQLDVSQISLTNATLGADTTCNTGGQLLDSAATCVLAIEFSPSSVGPNLPGTVTLTDNTLNNNGSTQTIDITGNGVKANQTITFTTAAPTGAALGAMFPVAATSNSGLPVTLTVDPASSSVCTLSGGTVTIISGSGTCTIDANQAGNANYNAATQVQSSTAAQTGPASQITFTVQPSNTMAGATISPAVVVKVADAGGNPLNGAAVTLTLQGGSAMLHGTVTAITNASGLAMFSGLSINTAGTYTLLAASGSVSGSSSSFIISAATSPVVITALQGDGQQTVVNAAYGSALQALVKDSFGNVVSGVSVTFTAPASGASATFSGTATVITNASGIAISPTLTANSQAGSFQVTAAATGAASPATFALTNTNVVKTNQTITFTTTGPATAAFGAIFPVAAASSSGLPVTLTVDASSAAVCTISGGLVTIISAVGICTIDANQAGDANFNPAAQVQSSTIAQAGTAAQVVFTTQPPNTTAGASFAVVVMVLDSGNHALNGAPVTLTLQGGAGTLNGTVTATTNASGQATFSGLSINIAGSYTLLATSGNASGLSNPFIISAATSPVTITTLQGDGQQAIAGLAFSGPLQALVQDSFGNAVSGASVTFTLPAGGPGATFSSAAIVTTNASGVAISPTLTANSAAGSFQVLASVTGAVSPATFTLTNIANTPTVTQLAFVQQPTDTIAGQDVTPAVTVQLLDISGNPVHTPGIPIAVQANTALLTKQLFSGNSTQNTDANGLATFANLSIAQVGTYQLQANAVPSASATSNVFHVTAGAPAAITPAGGDSQSAFVLTVFGGPLQVIVTDAAGNPVAGVPVTFTAPTSGPSGTFGGQSTITVNTNAQGLAQAVITANNIPGPFTVTATSTMVAGSVTFSLTDIPLAATMLRFVQQPSNTSAGQTIAPVSVQVQNSSGGPSNQAGIAVMLSLSSGTGSLLGTVMQVTDATGTATFNNLSIQVAGTKQLTASSASQTPAVSNSFIISAATNGLVITAYQGDGQQTITGTSFSGPLQALVDDAFGNVVSGVSVTFTAPPTGPSATFSGTATVTTNASGIAISPALTANGVTGSFQVLATATGAAAPATFTLTNIPNSTGVQQLAFVQQPTDTVAGQTITPAVNVQLLDSSGNPLHTAGVPIAVQSNAVLQAKKLFAGNATQNTDANGLATFANLSIAQVGAYQLQANATGAASATSSVFHIIAGAASAISPTGGASQSAFVLTVFPSPLQVTVTDAAGNPVGGVPVTFTAPSSGPSGAFGGQQAITVSTDAQGHAQVLITANGAAGSYSVIATSTALTGSATFSLTNVALAAAMLKFVQQPSNTPAGQTMAPVSVQIQNGSGGPSNQSGVAILLSLSSGTGALLGTAVQYTDATGTATFNDLSIGATGTKQLTARSTGQAPAVSNTFQITAGTPSTITAIQGTPQAAGTSTPFLVPLQAQVLDANGNPVSGVSVTFAAPSSGPGGTFAGAATVLTDSNGVATAPLLTANNTVGRFTATASVSGVANPATFSLAIITQTGSLGVTPTQLSFLSQANQPAPAGQTVQVFSAAGPLTWNASVSAPWISVSSASGTTPTTITISVNPAGLAPGNYSGSVLFTSNNGVVTVLVSYTIGSRPALVVTPASLIFSTPTNAISPPVQSLVTTSSAGTIGYAITVQINTPGGGAWLSVLPVVGQTPGSVQVAVNPAGLSNGLYTGQVLFTPVDATINSVAVPVTLLVGCGQGGCSGLPATIISVVNAASFHPSGAPGAAMTIFGTALSDSTYQALSYPLPTQLGPTTVTVNGSPVPLYYVSPTQINFQMPAGAPAADVQVAVNTASASKVLLAAQPHTSGLTVVDPGLFITEGNRAAALNQDLSVNTPATPQPAGALILLFITGQGPLTPPLQDGTAAPANPLSLINGTVSVSIGGKQAQVAYAGVAPGFAGLSQINAVIPDGLAPGDQPAFVTVNGVSSNAGLITVK